ncbi:glycosyltransferase, partial [Patescibacteria group bacterium]|nr:glycosyltransferase [Patescibacteria group bacterium]
TDDTAEKVRQVVKKYPIIELIDGKRRQGKGQRLNQLYGLNTSDVLITLDADIVLRDDHVFDNLVSAFDHENVALVGGNDQPLPARTFVEKVVNTGEILWYETRKNINDGDTIHNNRGRIMVLRRDLAQSITIPRHIVIDDYFVYLSCLAKNLKFRFSPSAVVYYRSPDNLKDYLTQTSRFTDADLINQIVDHFGDWVYEVCRVPKKHKARGLIKMFFSKPIFTPLALLFNLWVRVFPIKGNRLHKLGKWQTVKSTKKVAIKEDNEGSL